MVDHPAPRVDPADTGARVYTVQGDTGQAGRAVGVGRTFWSTCDVRVSEILWYALTCSSPSSSRADCILPTRRGVARVYFRCWCRGWNK